MQRVGVANRANAGPASGISTRLAALAGIAAPLLCGAGFIIVAAIRPGYSSVRQYGSDLAVGPNGWLQTTNFIVFGFLTMIFAFGLQRGIAGRGAAMVGPVLVAIFGLGWVLVGLFQGELHHDATYLFLALPTACFIMAPRLDADPKWRAYVPYTVATGAIAATLGSWWYVNHIRALLPDLTPWIGMYQRVFYAEMLCWLEVMAIRLFMLSRTPDVARRLASAAQRQR